MNILTIEGWNELKAMYGEKAYQMITYKHGKFYYDCKSNEDVSFYLDDIISRLFIKPSAEFPFNCADFLIVGSHDGHIWRRIKVNKKSLLASSIEPPKGRDFIGSVRLKPVRAEILAQYDMAVKNVIYAFAKTFYEEGDYENIEDCVEIIDNNVFQIEGLLFDLSDALTALELNIPSNIMIKWQTCKIKKLEYNLESFFKLKIYESLMDSRE